MTINTQQLTETQPMVPKSDVNGQMSIVSKHIPVLLNETLTMLDPKLGEFIIDGTADGGGHLMAIIKKMKAGKVLAVEWDKAILERAKERIREYLQTTDYQLQTIWANGNYADLPEILTREGLGKADGLLLDLGFSAEQLESQKGFSYAEKDIDEPLDMRYDRESGLPTAAEAINSLREDELADIIYQYGEERFSRRVAKSIVEERKAKKILTAKSLVEVIKKSAPKFFKKGEMDMVARVFQALRIYVNHEFDNVASILKKVSEIIRPGGRVAIITFHSLEDRIVKQAFKEMEGQGFAELINKKPIAATEDEIRRNPASRSAKLRGVKVI